MGTNRIFFISDDGQLIGQSQWIRLPRKIKKRLKRQDKLTTPQIQGLISKIFYDEDN
jgi:hypothetical protein